jgi:hypothetical protein
MAIRRSIKEMWLGATLSTLLHVGPIVLLLVGLPLLMLALSTDKKEPETVDTSAQAGARKAEAAAKKESKNIEVGREAAEGQKTEAKPTEDTGRSAPSINIQIISAAKVPSFVKEIIEKQTAAINKSKQPQPDKKEPTPASKTTETPTDQAKASPTDIAQTKSLTPAKAVNKERVPPPKAQAAKRKLSEVTSATKKPKPSKNDARKTKQIEIAQEKPVTQPTQKKIIIEKPSSKRGGGGADGADDTGAGGGKVGKSGASEGKEFGALLNPSRPIQSAKALIDVIEEQNPQLLAELSTSPAGNQTPERVQRQKRNFKRIEMAAKSGHANAQYNLAKLLMRGQGAKANPELAREWIQKAADRGYAKAQLLLGYLALRPGRNRDLAQADAMFWAAAQQGSKFSAAARKPLQRIMRASEILKSRRLRKELKGLFALLPISFGGGSEGDAKTKSNDKLRSSAAKGEVKDLLDSLLQGADVDGQDIDGKTAMINAAWRGRPEIIEILLDHGTDIEIADLRKRTPLMWGAINGQSSVVTTLIKAGAELDIPDDENVTALMRAAWNGHLSIVKQLIAAGADPNRRDNNGLSAIEHAKQEGHKAIVESLRIAIE